MNPRQKDELPDTDTQTARAFIQLFIKHYGDFTFPADTRGSDITEARTYYSSEVSAPVIHLQVMNDQDKLSTMQTTLEDMGLTIEYDGTSEDGDGTLYWLEASVPGGTYEWDVPHMVVYGSLSPEVENAARAAFGNEYQLQNIRNHYVVFGEGLDSSVRDDLYQSIGRSSEFFQDDKRSNKNWVNSAVIV